MKCATFMSALQRERKLVEHGENEYQKGYKCGYEKGLLDGEQKVLEEIRVKLEKLEKV